MKIKNKQIFILYLATSLILFIIIILSVYFKFSVYENGQYYYLTFHDYSLDWEKSFLGLSFILSLINLAIFYNPKNTNKTIYANLFILFNMVILMIGVTSGFFYFDSGNILGILLIFLILLLLATIVFLVGEYILNSLNYNHFYIIKDQVITKKTNYKSNDKIKTDDKSPYSSNNNTEISQARNNIRILIDLKELYDKGILSEEEYLEKKNKYLDKI